MNAHHQARDDARAPAREAEPALKDRLRALLPPPLWRALLSAWRRFKALRMRFALMGDYLYDLRRFAAWSHGVGQDRSRAQMEHALLKHYHSIEKGLSLPAPRPGFGADKARTLTARIDDWIARFGFTGMAPAATDALRVYRAFNAANGVDQPWLDAWLHQTEGKAGPQAEGAGGLTRLTAEEIRADVARGGEAFFLSRHSVRQYDPRPVPLEDIARAVRMAQKTPSVCNRQGPKAYCFADAREALKWQPGNTGFGSAASRALVITSDLQAFSGPGERNQAFIDGGMFAMSVVYALHSLGYGTCTLAWSMRPAADREMRSALGIPDSEVVIMMISVGVLPEALSVARSSRRPLEAALVMRGDDPSR